MLGRRPAGRLVGGENARRGRLAELPYAPRPRSGRSELDGLASVLVRRSKLEPRIPVNYTGREKNEIFIPVLGVRLLHRDFTSDSAVEARGGGGESSRSYRGRRCGMVAEFPAPDRSISCR